MTFLKNEILLENNYFELTIEFYVLFLCSCGLDGLFKIYIEYKFPMYSFYNFTLNKLKVGNKLPSIQSFLFKEIKFENSFDICTEFSFMCSYCLIFLNKILRPCLCVTGIMYKL